MAQKPLQTPRSLLLKARFYRVVAFVFAGVGLFVFLTVFSHTYEGDIVQAAHEPAVIFVILVPFFPAAVLAWISSSLEKKAITMLEKEKESS